MSFPARGQLEIFTCPRGASPSGKYISRVDRGSGKHFQLFKISAVFPFYTMEFIGNSIYFVDWENVITSDYNVFIGVDEALIKH